MLSKQGLKILCKVGASGQKFQIILLLWVRHSAAAQERRADIGTHAGLAPDEPRVDLQARLAARGAEQLMHPAHLLQLPDAELIHHTTGAGLFQHRTLHAAAGKQLLRQLHRMGLLGLQHKAAGIKVFGKAGKAIRCRTHAAVLLQAALCDLLPCTGCKAHSGSSILVSAWHRGAGHPARSRGMCSIPRSSAQR